MAAAAIDDRRGADDRRPGGAGHGDRLAGRTAGGQHVLDDQHAVGRRQGEAAAQRQGAVGALREDGADVQRAADFLADDDAAEGRRQHDCRRRAR